MSSKRKGLLWIAGAICLAVGFSEGIKSCVRHVSFRDESKLAATLPDPFVTYPQCDPSGSSHGSDALKKLVDRIYPLSSEDQVVSIQVQAVRNETINAFAYLGGRIFIFDGLLRQAESPEELAGVLAHEIEHVKKRHVLQSLSDRLILALSFHYAFGGGGEIFRELVAMRFTNRQEEDADRGALNRMREAHVDVRGFEQFFEREAKRSRLPAILTDHPSNRSRAELARQFEGLPSTPILNKEEWLALKSICH